MRQSYSYTVTQEGEFFVAQCLEVDVASQGFRIEQVTAGRGR